MAGSVSTREGGELSANLGGDDHLPFWIEDWLVEPSLNRISRGEAVVQLEPRVMDVLVLLAVCAGSVVQRRDLIDAVWKTEFVSENSLTHVIAELRSVLGDDARSPRFIETIPKRGYRLIAGVTAGDSPLRQAATVADASVRIAPMGRHRTLGVGQVLLAAAVLLAGGIVAATLGKTWRGSDHPRGVPRPPRIAVLPFDNLSEADDCYFASGVTEEITSRLAAVSGLDVISRTSAFNCDRRGKTASEIGADLAVDYILEGSVRFERGAGGSERVRITPQLIRVADDCHLWSAQYDRQLDEVFAVQADIGQRVVERLNVTLLDAEQRAIATEPTDNLAAYQLYLRGQAHLYSDEATDFETAIPFLERAVEVAPQFALAHARLALAHCFLYHFGCDADGAHATLAKRAAFTAKAIEPERPEVLCALGYVAYYIDHDLNAALEQFETAARLTPNHSDAVAAMSYILRRQGRWEESLVMLERALESDPLNPSHLWNLGTSLILMRRHAEADEVLMRAIRFTPGMRTPHFRRALNFVRWHGDTVRARQVLADMPGSRTGQWLEEAYAIEVFDGRYDRALDLLSTEGWEETSDPTPVELLRCECYQGLGRTEEAAWACEDAARALEQELAQYPDRRIMMALASAHARLGHREVALGYAEQAVAEVPVDRDAVEWAMYSESLALVYLHLGEHDMAAAVVEDLLTAPSLVTVPMLRQSAIWAPLRSHPRIAVLIADDRV
jgi:TolB-like protein/DNA-binding winged helix-turn-helix (wHTH) protein